MATLLKATASSLEAMEEKRVLPELSKVRLTSRQDGRLSVKISILV